LRRPRPDTRASTHVTLRLIAARIRELPTARSSQPLPELPACETLPSCGVPSPLPWHPLSPAGPESGIRHQASDTASCLCQWPGRACCHGREEVSPNAQVPSAAGQLGDEATRRLAWRHQHPPTVGRESVRRIHSWGPHDGIVHRHKSEVNPGGRGVLRSRRVPKCQSVGVQQGIERQRGDPAGGRGIDAARRGAGGHQEDRTCRRRQSGGMEVGEGSDAAENAFTMRPRHRDSPLTTFELLDSSSSHVSFEANPRSRDQLGELAPMRG
jgi:hypothetical protein